MSVIKRPPFQKEVGPSVFLNKENIWFLLQTYILLPIIFFSKRKRDRKLDLFLGRGGVGMFMGFLSLGLQQCAKLEGEDQLRCLARMIIAT